MPPIAGICITDDAVRVVEYRDKYGKFSLKAGAEYPLTNGIVSGGVIADQAKLVEFLKKIAKDHNITSCVLALPEEKAFVYATSVTVDKSAGEPSKKISEKQLLGPAVEATLAQNIPLSAKDAVFDFSIASFDKKTLSGEVIIFAFPLDAANAYLEALLHADITPVAFETESLAVVRAVVPHGSRGAHLILHFMGHKAVIAVVLDGVVHYASTVFHVSGAGEPVEPIMVKDELMKVALYWNSEKRPKLGERGKIQSVIVSGKVDKMLDFPDYISKNLQIPGSLANVWQNAFSLNETIPDINFEKSLAFAAASGSALAPFLK